MKKGYKAADKRYAIEALSPKGIEYATKQGLSSSYWPMSVSLRCPLLFCRLCIAKFNRTSMIWLHEGSKHKRKGIRIPGNFLKIAVLAIATIWAVHCSKRPKKSHAFRPCHRSALGFEIETETKTQRRWIWVFNEPAPHSPICSVPW